MISYQLLLFLAILTFAPINCQGTSDNVVPAKVSSTNPPETAPAKSSLCSTCNCTDRIVNCADKGLTQDGFNNAKLPNKSLELVSFEGNLLVRITPFPKLEIGKLILRKNQITEIDQGAFKQLINLTELDLSQNQLTSELLTPHAFKGRFSPEAYEPLKKLRVLNLAQNKLHSLHQDLFEHLENLKTLNLSGNPFGVIDVRTTLAISALVYLEKLDLSYCNLKSLPDNFLHNLRYLKIFNLTDNRLSTIPLTFEEATKLEYLYLDENPIQIIDHNHGFPRMPRLKELSLCCMPHLTVVGKGAFSGLTALEILAIKNSPKLEDIDEYALADQTSETTVWPPLKKLDLSDNALRYLPYLLLGRWDRLEVLNITNNKWSCDCNNQELIGSLLPKYGQKLMGNDSEKLLCSMPPEHEGKNLVSLSHRRLRCPDLYGAQPEKDAAILVGMLIGLLLAIPLALVLFVFWRRGFFFCGSQGPASFSRAFYKRAANEEDL